MPQISIIIPTYKRQGFLEEAIKSVLKQTFQDFEIIVVDDENSNETKTIIKDLNDKRIRYISHKNNRGVGAARNTGIKAATSQYLFFLDDDDLLPNNALESLFNNIEKVSNTKIGELIGSMAFFIEKGGKKQFFSHLKLPAGATNHIQESGKGLIKREVFKKIGLYDENLKTSEDTEMAFRFFHKYISVTIPDIVYFVRRHENPSLHNRKGSSDDYLNVLNKYKKDLKKYPPKSYARITRTIGINLCLEGKMKKGRKFIFKSILKYPFYFKSYVALFFSLFGQKLFHKIYLLNRKKYFKSICLKSVL